MSDMTENVTVARGGRRLVPGLLGVAVMAGLAACSPAPVATGISDPNEAQNRRIFEQNLQLDRAVFGSAGQDAAAASGDNAALERVADFAANVSLPSSVVNDLLQGNIEDAVHNTWRFAFNTTLGLGGLFDVATGMGLEERRADFGQTLHVWGVPEGDFVMLPVLGPSTNRDTAGMFVDLFTNPLTYLLPGDYAYLPLGARIAGLFSSRITYGSALDDLIYGAADPYATARLYYLDNRRHQLGGPDATDQDLYDIYEEAYD